VPKRSAGLLLWRRRPDGVEVLLGHPGGPLFARRDDGVWSVPKGEYPADEPPLEAAYREFAEELGTAPPDGHPVHLGDVVLRSGKVVTVFAQEGDLDPAEAHSNLFTMEWPPRSGQLRQFPELDRVGWFDLPTARVKLAERQRPFLDRLAAAVHGG
jgi:predicted NUDIX family NTP pyrophosphohydrolase